jgi:hypothetical protein
MKYVPLQLWIPLTCTDKRDMHTYMDPRSKIATNKWDAMCDYVRYGITFKKKSESNHSHTHYRDV